MKRYLTIRYYACHRWCDDCGIVLAYFRWIRVNPAIVGFTFLVAILVVSTAWGMRYAVFMAVVATLAYNYFFFPPVLRFIIADPQNWAVLFAFLFTAVIASQLSERARREAVESNQRRRELERLYAFSQQLLATDNVFELLNSIPRYIVDSFSISDAAMFLNARQQSYYMRIESQSLFPSEQLEAISSRGEPVLDRQHSLCFMPLRLGVRAVGSIALAGCDLSRETLEAIGSLTAIAIERANALEKLTKTEAARESDRLRSVLLDSVTHEFRTPLTAIKASAETLLSDVELDKPQRRDLLAVINEESDRLNRLVGEAAEVAQLDSHQLEFHFEPHHIREALDDAINASRQALQRHPLQLNVPDNLPLVRIDIDRITEGSGPPARQCREVLATGNAYSDYGRTPQRRGGYQRCGSWLWHRRYGAGDDLRKILSRSKPAHDCPGNGDGATHSESHC